MTNEEELAAALQHKHSDEWSDAIIQLIRLAQDEPEAAWRVIFNIVKLNPLEEVLGLIGAGPLEDLMQFHGRDFIDRVEIESKTNSKLRHLLNGIYRGDIDDKTWNRIAQVSGQLRQK